MKVGLIDVDGHAKKKKWGATIYPNLALCKIASYHRSKGDDVEWYQGLFGGEYDLVYMAKVFSFSPDYKEYVNAKKVMGWCKGDGDYYTINRHKDHRKSFWRRCERLRPMYYDREREVWVQPSCHDIDIIRRAHTRLFRWIRKGKKFKEQLK